MPAFAGMTLKLWIRLYVCQPNLIITAPQKAVPASLGVLTGLGQQVGRELPHMRITRHLGPDPQHEGPGVAHR